MRILIEIMQVGGHETPVVCARTIPIAVVPWQKNRLIYSDNNNNK